MSQNYPSTMAGTSAGVVSPRLRLTHLTGSLANTSFDVDPANAADAVTFGRIDASSVRYDHDVDFLVSARHGKLVAEAGEWVVYDPMAPGERGSTNGTYVDGARVDKRAVLRSGQVVTLGTPNAQGSASFRVEFDPSAEPTRFGEGSTPWDVGDDSVVLTPSGLGSPSTPQQPKPQKPNPFSQGSGGPSSIPGGADVVKFPEQPFGGSRPAADPAKGAPAAKGAAAAEPAKAVVTGKAAAAGFDSFRLKSELQKLKKQVPEMQRAVDLLQAEADRACGELGKELWQPNVRDKVTQLPAITLLADAEKAVEKATGKRAQAEHEHSLKGEDFQSLVAEWKEQADVLDGEVAAADQALADAQAGQNRAREAVVAALAPKAEVVGRAAEQMGQWAAEAKADPRDDAWQRLLEIVEGIERQASELAVPVPRLPDLMAARAETKDAVEAAKRQHDEVVARAEDHRKERAAMDAARADQDKFHRDQLAAIKVEMDIAVGRFPVAYNELGRQFVAAKNPPAVTPLPPSVSTARSAVGKWSLKHTELEETKKRVAELERSLGS
jgi:pSer/pThr/pTyr-binding forkhead associated (FHA) protein